MAAEEIIFGQVGQAASKTFVRPSQTRTKAGAVLALRSAWISMEQYDPPIAS